MDTDNQKKESQELKYGVLPPIVTLQCWEDPQFKKNLLANPLSELKDLGFEIPNELNVKIVENTANTIYLVLPEKDPTSPDLDKLRKIIILTTSSGQCCATGTCK